MRNGARGATVFVSSVRSRWRVASGACRERCEIPRRAGGLVMLSWAGVGRRAWSSSMVYPRKRMPSSASSRDVSYRNPGMPRMPPITWRRTWAVRVGAR